MVKEDWRRGHPSGANQERTGVFEAEKAEEHSRHREQHVQNQGSKRNPRELREPQAAQKKHMTPSKATARSYETGEAGLIPSMGEPGHHAKEPDLILGTTQDCWQVLSRGVTG